MKKKSRSQKGTLKVSVVSEAQSDLFEKLMKSIKVKPIQANSSKHPPKSKLVNPEPIIFDDCETLPKNKIETVLDRKFQGISDSPQKRSPRVNRKTKVTRNFKPDFQIDLHGMIRDEALIAVEEVIQTAQKKRLNTVLIITGKGAHSGNKGAVLRNAVGDWLKRNQDILNFQFRKAPARLGGSGAFLVQNFR